MKVGFTTQLGQRIRRRTLRADAWDRLPEEIAAAKKRWALPVGAPVTSCDEAGRDGFWIHRYLTRVGVENLVVDSSSLEVNRRARRAKTDVIDLEKLLSMLRRPVSGEKKVWHVVHIPSEQDEERRQPHRDRWTLKRDRTRVTNRITGVLATVGVYAPNTLAQLGGGFGSERPGAASKDSAPHASATDLEMHHKLIAAIAANLKQHYVNRVIGQQLADA